MRKSASQDCTEMRQTVVLKDSEIEGDIILPGNLCLFGKISGNVTAKGKVEVKSGAVVTGNISCRELEIEGLVGGNLFFNYWRKCRFGRGCAGRKTARESREV